MPLCESCMSQDTCDLIKPNKFTNKDSPDYNLYNFTDEALEIINKKVLVPYFLNNQTKLQFKDSDNGS